jgi:hypothetical protein
MKFLGAEAEEFSVAADAVGLRKRTALPPGTFRGKTGSHGAGLNGDIHRSSVTEPHI